MHHQRGAMSSPMISRDLTGRIEAALIKERMQQRRQRKQLPSDTSIDINLQSLITDVPFAVNIISREKE